MLQPRLLAAALGLLLLSACRGSGDGSNAVGTPTARPDLVATPIGVDIAGQFVIGVSVDLSGDQQASGVDIADAVDLAIEDAGGTIGGTAVISRREDDGCNAPEQAVDVARALLQVDGLLGVVGPMCTVGAQAANDEYETAGVVHISPTSTRSDLSALGQRFFFRVAWQDNAQAAAQARFIVESIAGASTVVIDDGDAYGRALSGAVAQALQDGGTVVIARERIEQAAPNFRSLARQVVASDPDAVVFEGFDPQGAMLLRDLRDEGYEGLFVGPDSLFSLQAFVAAAGEAAEGAVLTAGPVPDEAFTTRFNDRFGRMPSTPFVLQAYDATTLLIKAANDAIAGGGGVPITIDRGALADAMRSLRTDGLTGAIAFDERGDRSGDTASARGLAIFRVSGAGFERLQ